MCELRAIFKGNTIMENVVRITVDKDAIKLRSILGETKTIRGRIIEVNITKQEAVIGE